NRCHGCLPPRRSPEAIAGIRPGVVPLGIPMMVGPAVLTTLLTLARTYGYRMTVIAFALNLAIVWVALRWAPLISRVLSDARGPANPPGDEPPARGDRGDLRPPRRDGGADEALTAPL